MPRFSRYRGGAEADYEGLREALAPRLRHLPAEDIEALFESADLSAEDIEGFFDTLKDIGKAVVSAAPAILPVAGTIIGTAYGGPVGAALGNTLGTMAGGAIGQATGARPAAARPQAASVQSPSAGAAALPGAAPAAGQLMQTMFRPEMLQALMQMLLGQLGGSNVKVGSTPVPVDAFTNLLGTLASQAQAQRAAAAARLWRAPAFPNTSSDLQAKPLAIPPSRNIAPRGFTSCSRRPAWSRPALAA